MPEPLAGPRINVKIAGAINYAAWLNDVPLLRALQIDNTDGTDLSDVSLTFEATPPFARPRVWPIDRLRAGEVYTLGDHRVEIDPQFMERLNEADRGQLLFRLTRGDEQLGTACHELRVLARDEWGGTSTMAELLPAFVTPNESAIAALQRDAAEVLANWSQSTALSGYQSGQREPVWWQTAALWEAVVRREIIYSNPPSSFERDGQKIRRASQILESQLATCLDLAVLFASALEAIGLNPVLVLQRRHAFVGVWLCDKQFEQPLEHDCGELRKALQAEDFIVFETTLATHRGKIRLDEAQGKAAEALSESQEVEFEVAIDIKRSRMARVKPLPSRDSERSGAAGDQPEQATAPSLPEVPAAPEFKQPPAMTRVRVVEPMEEPPRTPAERIENWRRKLLDLTLRNRLLNYRATQQTVPLARVKLSELEDRLADGASLELKPLPASAGERSAEAPSSLERERELAQQTLERRGLLCLLGPDELAKRLTTLRRKVANDQAEGGANTLYLAIGFLRWREAPADSRTFRAPLLLLPVQLSQQAARAAFKLALTDDEPRFNATLAEKLKRDFGLDLSPLVAALPMDDGGVDVPRMLDEVRHAVRELRGVEVVEESVLASFSFAKYLMWKDLSERLETIERNRVVAHLVHQAGQPFHHQPTGPLPVASELDNRYRPEQIVHPLPADSSQLAAVMAADDGRDFVIVGPPGTGKSQTIANLIAQCVARGRTVLFVAEKAAALNVVHRRLKEHGLADRCVELHSHKAGRKHFLEQLKRAWQSRGPIDIREWDESVREVAVRRDLLNGYAAALHQRADNGWTPVMALGESSARREVAAPKLEWPASTRHNNDDYQRQREAIQRLADAFAALPGGAPVPLVRQREWSMDWEHGLLDACEKLRKAAMQLRGAHTAFAALLALPHRDDAPLSLHQPLEGLASRLATANSRLRDLLALGGLEALSERITQRDTLLKALEAARRAVDEAAARLVDLIAGQPSDFQSSEVGASGGWEKLERLATELPRWEASVRAPAPDAASSVASRAALSAAQGAAPVTASSGSLPPDELVHHERFDLLVEMLGARARLLHDRERASADLHARGFSPTLIERIPIDRLEFEWRQANAALWPLSLWHKQQLKAKLKAFMQPGAAPALEVDLAILADYRKAVRGLAENLELLGLSPPLRQRVEQNPQALDESLAAARSVRGMIRSAGGLPEQAGVRSGGKLLPLLEAARQFSLALASLRAADRALADNVAALALPAGLRTAVEADFAEFQQLLTDAVSVRESLRSLAGEDVFGRESRRLLDQWLAAPPPAVQAAAKAYGVAMRPFKLAWKEYLERARAAPISDKSLAFATDAIAQAERVTRERTALRPTVDWNSAEHQAERLGLKRFADELRTRTFPPHEAVARFELAYARWWLPRIISERAPLRDFQRLRHERTIAEFRHWDQRARETAPLRVLSHRPEELPDIEAVTQGTELFKLRRQINDGRPRKSIREMIEQMPTMFPLLAPCLLMSPLSIAQYLPANLRQFDIVVFDEASQITTWDAIGAIARGRQTIVVGDPNQLPPTSFFERADDGEEDDDNATETIRDMPSILDELISDGLPAVRLSWHYRSQHESLIAFSNRQYYDSGLATFPAADNRDRGVSFVQVADAVYDRGRTRTNRREAEAIVADLVARMAACLRNPEERRLTYGVVTFNKQQQDLIEDLLDDARRQQPELEWFFAEERFEPTMVKNLENVQGDERDVMIFSITFGFDARGAFPVDFGALNRDGGHRRLNVAVTRARRTLAVYASFRPDQLQASRSNARGVRDLKAFLEYAQRGATGFTGRESAPPPSRSGQLEESIAQRLESLGWTVQRRVGVSDFRVDLGIVHPDKPGTFLAGVECDGERYGRSTVARDRDITRGVVLSSLGWHILRVWSIDWWYAPKETVQRLHEQLEALLQQDREDEADRVRDAAKAAGESSSTAPAEPPPAANPLAANPPAANPPDTSPRADSSDTPASSEAVASPVAAASSEPPSGAPRGNAVLASVVLAELPPAKVVETIESDATSVVNATLASSNRASDTAKAWYEPLVLADASANRERFDKPEYTQALRDLVLSVVMSHGPIREDVLAERVAKCHGFQRTGRNIRERILGVLPWTIVTKESVGRFLWPTHVPAGFIPFRHTRPGDTGRDVSEIPIQELVGLVIEQPQLAASADPPQALARELGIERITQPVRARLAEAIELARSTGPNNASQPTA